jgi:hypothetical protein
LNLNPPNTPDAGPEADAKSRGLMLANIKGQALTDACPAGGVEVELGVDQNGDGTLSADEVTRIVTICNGESGKAALIDVRDEAEGDGCPSGGIRVLSGLDADSDEILDDEEVVRNELLCHGSAGTNGVTTIVQLQEVEAGEQCSAGGVNIIIGIDMDGDDALSEPEIRQEGVVCHGEPGPPGTSCSVTRDDVLGITTVTCEDGTSAVISDGNDCSTERDEASSSTTIRCEDGTEVVVQDGATGESGAPGTNCTVTRNESAGTATVNCEDGTSATIQDGRDGANGTSCTVTRDESAGSTTIACEDGTTATVYDGQDGAQGPAGPRGDAGPAGPQGPPGSDGTDGTSCTVTDNGNGTKTIACGDGTSVTVADGATGAAGSSCMVTDNGNGTKTVSCDDGTSVIVSDGAAGQDGAAGEDGANGNDGLTSLIRLEAELGGPVCPYSGTKILSGVDDNGDDVLQDEEVDDEAVVCSSTPGDCASDFHTEGDGVCVSDTRDCVVLNGTGTETWTGSAWGACDVTGCDTSYHEESGACVSDNRACAVTNGIGSQQWENNAWGICQISSCDAGFEDNGNGSCLASCNSLQLNSQNPNEVFTNTSNIDIGLSDFTLDGWFYLSGDVGERWLFHHRDGNGENYLTLRTDADDFPILWLVDYPTNVWAGMQWRAESSLPIGEWFHLSAERNAGAINMFLNGVPMTVSLQTGSGDPGAYTLNNSGPITFGANGPADTNANAEVLLHSFRLTTLALSTEAFEYPLEKKTNTQLLIYTQDDQLIDIVTNTTEAQRGASSAVCPQ